MEELFEYISNRISLSSEAEKYINSISKRVVLQKDDILVQQGQKINKTYFVAKGCMRSFATDKKGKENTLQFAVKNWWISDFMKVFNNELSSLTIVSITESILIEFNISDLEILYQRFPEFEAFQRKNLENHVASLQKRLLNQLQLTANQRYSLFVEQYPEIERYSPNYHIASYLGITQQSLSRIRSEKARN